MSDDDKKDKKLVFHYTSEEGIKGISMSGKINPSVKRDGDVTFGVNKVYMNDLHPEKNTSYDIARNNYDHTPKYATSRMPDTKYAIGYDSKEIRAKRETKDRSVYTAKGSLPLDKAEVVYKLGSDGKYEKIASKDD